MEEEAPAADQTRVDRWNLWPILGFPCIYDLNKPKPPRECVVQPTYRECYGGRPVGPRIRVSSEKDRPSAGMPREHACGPSIHAQGWWISPKCKTYLSGVTVHVACDNTYRSVLDM